jgi:hypothetical protein
LLNVLLAVILLTADRTNMRTDLEVVSLSRDGKRMTLKVDGSYAVLARKSNRDQLFVGKVAGKTIQIPLSAARNAKGG